MATNTASVVQMPATPAIGPAWAMALRRCAEQAMTDEPTSIDARARTFAACVASSLGVFYDKELGDFLFQSVLTNPAPRFTSTDVQTAHPLAQPK